MLLKKILIVLILFTSLLIVGNAYGQTSSPTPTTTSSKSGDLENKIKEYQSKITELQGQAKSLSSQLAVMDNQIKLTEFRIASSKQQLEELGVDIQVASTRAARLNESLSNVTKVLMKRIVATYQVGDIQPIQILLASNNIPNAFKKVQYLKIVQEHDKKLLYNTEQAKNDYKKQQGIFESKKEKVEALNEQLKSYTLQLDNQKVEKEELLAATKNSESEYQKRLADAQRELRSISKAAQVLVSTEPRKVGRGEQIGLMGNTGYSFGAHLHFGIYNITSLDQYNYYSNYDNPANSLEGRSVDWGTGCGGDPNGQTNTGSGTFAWPMATANLNIGQGYGITCYSNVYYGGKPHPAFDMYNNSDIVIRAVEEGQAYFCRNCTGDGANGVFVFHPNGKMSLYWHLQ